MKRVPLRDTKNVNRLLDHAVSYTVKYVRDVLFYIIPGVADPTKRAVVIIVSVP
jgi:uncharacterized protein YggE